MLFVVYLALAAVWGATSGVFLRGAPNLHRAGLWMVAASAILVFTPIGIGASVLFPEAYLSDGMGISLDHGWRLASGFLFPLTSILFYTAGRGGSTIGWLAWFSAVVLALVSMWQTLAFQGDDRMWFAALSAVVLGFVVFGSFRLWVWRSAFLGVPEKSGSVAL